MINVSVIGATGYVGYELARLLINHPEAELVHLVSQSNAGKRLEDMYPALLGSQLPAMEGLTAMETAKDSDVVFTALPHGAGAGVIKELFEAGVKIVDMSGDFRYDDPAVYEKWYGLPHSSPDVLKNAVYGLPELHRAEIALHSLIGNPGCYTTCSILAMAPLVKNGLIDLSTIVIDAKSGSTGAGKGPKADMQFCEVDENLKAYGVTTHRHTSEIEQELSKLANKALMVSFTPHLLPVKRGILSTCYAALAPGCHDATTQSLLQLYEDFYGGEPFVQILPQGRLPELKHVVGSNKCAIGLVVDARLNRVVVISCIDNLIKGAAGQAVQNMNIMFGLEEEVGLPLCGWGL